MDRILELTAEIKNNSDFQTEQDEVTLPLFLVEQLVAEVEDHFGPVPDVEEADSLST